MFCLVCFDIVDDRNRARVARTLKAYGVRVQKSVFECGQLSEEKFLKLKNRLEDLIDTAEDTVRYYFVCKTCLDKMEFSGIGEAPKNANFRWFEYGIDVLNLPHLIGQMPKGGTAGNFFTISAACRSVWWTPSRSCRKRPRPGSWCARSAVAGA